MAETVICEASTGVGAFAPAAKATLPSGAIGMMGARSASWSPSRRVSVSHSAMTASACACACASFEAAAIASERAFVLLCEGRSSDS